MKNVMASVFSLFLRAGWVGGCIIKCMLIDDCLAAEDVKGALLCCHFIVPVLLGLRPLNVSYCCAAQTQGRIMIMVRCPGAPTIHNQWGGTHEERLSGGGTSAINHHIGESATGAPAR